MSHNAALMLSGIGFLMKGKIYRLLRGEPVVGRQSSEDFARPVTELLLSGAGGIEFRHCTFPDDGTEVIDLGPKLGEHGREKHFILADAKRFGRFYNYMNMSRRFRMDQLIR